MPRLASSRQLALFLALLALTGCAGSGPSAEDRERWEARAAAVTITRDDWGIPHIAGPTDADAVFGMMYAQAEDDFNRIEVNFLNSQGRLAEAEGESAIWRDLRMKLFIHPDTMRARYASSPDWLKTLMDAWADGLNYYLFTHPEVQPRVLTRFEPWMALTFSEGSIGGDIESISLRELEKFYNEPAVAPATAGTAGGTAAEGPAPRTRRGSEAQVATAGIRTVPVWAPYELKEPSGSNGFAITPANSASGHALLLINPHTSFFFREELQVTSGEGLNAYGAVTWGQFFVYQGFNDRTGWMHTSSGADAIDEYAETVTAKEAGFVYQYGAEERPVVAERIDVAFTTDTGMATRTFTVYRTHHGPVVRAADGKWIAVKLMQEPVKALTQSYTRTKARSLAEFRASMDLHTNSSNNTIYADADGHIAYFHANFVPKRDPRFDWRRPVDGSDPATEWGTLHTVDESPLVIDPASGWLYNTNNWPYTAAGAQSPRRSAFPGYMDYNLENPRGVHAMEVLGRTTGFTLQRLIDAAYDPHLTAFDALAPAFVQAYDRLPASAPEKATLREVIDTLRAWDRRSGIGSVATTVAVLAGEALWTAVRADPEAEGSDLLAFMATKSQPAMRIAALDTVVKQLTADFGSWKTPWGEINRFQRLTGDIAQPFNDSGPSLPVGFTSSRWGSLAAFGARTWPGTKKLYGTLGNSFVAVVEFGDTLRARAVTAGGLNSVPGSAHFNDQAARYAKGDLREVYFHPWQLEGHTERTYKPGAR
ncbi:MAG: penicillin acylase family protein [Gemmatimonadota bacterium]|nr:penicillin acylase family protein [Gemmatimonadota bacterium]